MGPHLSGCHVIGADCHRNSGTHSQPDRHFGKQATQEFAGVIDVGEPFGTQIEGIQQFGGPTRLGGGLVQTKHRGVDQVDHPLPGEPVVDEAGQMPDAMGPGQHLRFVLLHPQHRHDAGAAREGIDSGD